MPILGEEIIYAQGVTLPGLSINPIRGYNQGLILKMEGDTYELEPSTISLIVDENFRLIKKIYSIFKDAIHPNNSTIAPDFHFECIIEVTDNTGHPIYAMELHRCALQNISPITLLSNSEDDIITVDFTIEPSYYEIIDKLEDSELVKKIVKS